MFFIHLIPWHPTVSYAVNLPKLVSLFNEENEVLFPIKSASEESLTCSSKYLDGTLRSDASLPFSSLASSAASSSKDSILEELLSIYDRTSTSCLPSSYL